MTKILCFGDSITKGYTRFGSEYYPYSEYLKTELSKNDQTSSISTFKVIESGINGETVVNSMEERLNHLLSDSSSEPYEYVILLGGLNDMAAIMYQKTEINDVINAFKYIYKLLDDNTHIKKFIHITIPNCILDCRNNGNSPYSQFKNKINDTICNLYSSKKIMLDLRDHDLYQLNPLYLNEEQQDLYWDDGLHFTKEGYLLLAKNIYNIFKNEVLLK